MRNKLGKMCGVFFAIALAFALGGISGFPTPEGRAAAQVPAIGSLRPLSTSPDHQIVDDLGRQVLLRGANVNSLGRYWQGITTIPSTLPVTNSDWDTMAAHGFSVIRLIVSWSRIEPSRGVFDSSYLNQVADYVNKAAAHGIYSVIDMHQDAYTDTIYTTNPASCPRGTTPAKGWDGAPAWATITDGLSTCLAGSDRNSSPAVVAAWNHFWDNTNGIRTEFAKAWGFVSARFAGNPDVAGFDLLNEPEVSRPSAQITPLYDDMIHDSVVAIRNAEHAAGASFNHIVFVEPGLPAGNSSFGLVIPDPAQIGLGTTNVVAAPHNYAESIDNPSLNLTIEKMSSLFNSIAANLGLPVWIGEYGFWDTSAPTLAKVRRYAANEDAMVQGGAWWQWRQSCGDPHSVSWQGNSIVAPSGTETHLNLLGCPSNADQGPNTAFLDVLGRAYPRATPGRISHLSSDPDTGVFSVEATAQSSDVGHQLVVWTPTSDDAAHRVSTTGLSDVEDVPVPGGRIITATVVRPGAYSLSIASSSTTTSTIESTTTQPSNGAPFTPRPAAAVTAVPTYAG